MYISEQLLNPNERRLQLSAQLGVGNVVWATAAPNWCRRPAARLPATGPTRR